MTGLRDNVYAQLDRCSPSFVQIVIRTEKDGVMRDTSSLLSLFTADLYGLHALVGHAIEELELEEGA